MTKGVDNMKVKVIQSTILLVNKEEKQKQQQKIKLTNNKQFLHSLLTSCPNTKEIKEKVYTFQNDDLTLFRRAKQ